MTSSRPFARRFVINTAATGASNLWAIAVTLITLPIALRGLGATAFGVWALVQTFSVFTGWGSLVDVGVGIAGTRGIAERTALEDETGARRTAGATVIMAMLPTLAFAAALAVVGPGVLRRAFDLPVEMVDDAGLALQLFAVQIIIDQVIKLTERLLEGGNRVDLSRLVETIRRTVSAVAVAIAAMVTGSLVAVATVSLITAVPLAIGSVAFTCRYVRFARPRRTDVVELLSYAVRVGALRPIGTLHRVMDRVVVGAILGPAAVSVVEIATQVQSGADAVLGGSSAAVMPSAAWLGARGEQTTRRRLLTLGTKYSLVATLPFVIGPAILAAPLVDAWVGSEGAEAAGVVALGLAYVGITAPAQISGEMLIGTGRAGVVFRGALAAVLVNLAVTLILVPQIGVAGAFVGTLCGAPFVLGAIIPAAVRDADWSIAAFLRESILPVVAPAVLLAAVCTVVVLTISAPVPAVLVGGVAGALVYAVAALRWAVPREEIRALVTTLRPAPEAASPAPV